MGNLGKDAKDLLIGKDGSEKEPEENFEVELQHSLKKGIISVDDGKKLTTARINVDNHANKLNKNQLDEVKRINDAEVYESAEEAAEAIKKKERKKKKEEEERKRRENEAKVVSKASKPSKEQEDTQKQKEREN